MHTQDGGERAGRLKENRKSKGEEGKRGRVATARLLRGSKRRDEREAVRGRSLRWTRPGG